MLKYHIMAITNLLGPIYSSSILLYLKSLFVYS